MFRFALRVVAALIVAAVGFFPGFVIGSWLTIGRINPATVTYSPLPHSVPKGTDGVPLRFAMVHDVLHERFPKHGPAYYLERNRLSRQKLAALKPGDPAAYPHLDDLSAGLARLGEFDEAIRIQREKLAAQRAAGREGNDLYSSVANLGTFLMIANTRGFYTGEAAAVAQFRESVGLVKESVRVNPASHFGRERWQVVLGEFLLATHVEPGLRTTFDFIGNRLDAKVPDLLDYEGTWFATESRGRPYTGEWSRDGGDIRARLMGERAEELTPQIRARTYITRVGAEWGWTAAPSLAEPVAFDEPVLGIIGMWRQGGGANPHFALALAETMLRVGQRNIAWSAYERTGMLADGFSADTAINSRLLDHCRQRQRDIEATWHNSKPRDRGVPTLTSDEIAELRSKFVAELNHGLAYQKAYQDFEAAEIVEGRSIENPQLFETFFARRDPIATPSGPEELFAAAPRTTFDLQYAIAGGVLGAGLSVTIYAVLQSVTGRRRYPPAAPPG